MSKLISSLKWIVDLLENIVSMIENFFSSLIAVISNIPKVIEFLTGAITALPAPLIIFATITIGITVAYFVVGRQEGGNS